jgi:hypothetical protein
LEQQKEGGLANEASLIILDFLEAIIQEVRSDINSHDQSVMAKLVHTWSHLLQRIQSNYFLHRLFASLRAFLEKYRRIFYAENNSYLGDIAQEILRYCNSTSDDIRSEASAFLYVMIKLNQQEVGNIVRMNIQATNALSQLASDGRLTHDTEIFKNALSVIPEYALCDYSTPLFDLGTSKKNTERDYTYVKASFARSVQELSSKLSSILQDTLKVNKLMLDADPETIHDLYFQIANGYGDTPQLRITWLDGLSKLHVKESNWPEASMCELHKAALIAEYLNNQQELPLDLSLFQTICPDISEVVGDDVSYQSTLFTDKGLIYVLNTAIRFFKEVNKF